MKLKTGDLLQYNYFGEWLSANVFDDFDGFIVIEILDLPDGTIILDRPVLDLQNDEDLSAIAAPF